MRQLKNRDITSTTKITKLITQNVIYPSLSTDKQKLYFFSNSDAAAFFSANSDGTSIQQISDKMDTPDEIIWSPNHQLAILKVNYNQYVFEKYGSVFKLPGTTDQTLTNWLYNFQTKKLSHLNNNIGNIVWLGDDKIMYQYLEEEKNSSYLATSHPDGTSTQNIIDLPNIQNYDLSLLDNNNIVLSAIPTDVSQYKIYILNLDTKKIEEQTKISASFSGYAFSNNILFNLYSNNKSGNLTSFDIKDQEIKDLGVKAQADTLTTIDNNDFLFINIDKSNNYLAQYDLPGNKFTKIVKITQDNPHNLMYITSKLIYFTSDNILYKAELK
jgi:hypothetical protein